MSLQSPDATSSPHSGYPVFVKLIPLELIAPNPYQARLSEDAEHVAKIAASIKAEELMQYPVCRQKGDFYELAFGHTRLAAYRLLLEQASDDAEREKYNRIPVIIRELDNWEMFRYGAQENLARANLTPIEEANLMRMCKEKFGKTSAEIGAMFNLSESTVRGKMRLADLPEEGKKALEEGKISEGVARRLLTIQTAMGPEKTNVLAETLTNRSFEKPEQVEFAIANHIKEDKEALQITSSWTNDGKAKSNFPLDWQPGRNSELTFAQFKKVYKGDAGPITVRYPLIDSLNGTFDRITCPSSVPLKDAFSYLLSWVVREEGSPETIFEKRLAESAPEILEAIRELIDSPACTKCPFYLIASKDGYCTRKVCYDRKLSVWARQRVEEVSKEIAIKPFNKATDGSHFVRMGSYYTETEYKWFEKAFNAKAAHLRLVYDPSKSYSKKRFTNDDNVELVTVDAKKVAAFLKNKESPFEEERSNWMQEQEKERANADRSRSYIEEVLAIQFGRFLYGSLPAGALCYLSRSSSALENRDSMLSQLGWNVLNMGMSYKELKQGPIFCAKHIQGIATEIGLKLPDEVIQAAEQFEVK